MNKSDHTKKKL